MNVVETPKPPRTIKRYANRKLYDTRDSRYITLPQIAEYIRRGEEVRIIDNATKDDLTHVTLAQIIYDAEKKGEDDRQKLSIGALRGMIQQRSEKLMSSLREGPVGRLIARRDLADTSAEAQPNTAHPSGAQGEKAADGKSVRDTIEDLQRVADDGVRGLLSSLLGYIHGLEGEVKRLESRLDDVESRLKTGKPSVVSAQTRSSAERPETRSS